MSVDIELPIAPSVNALWRISGKRLIRTDAYKAWLNECGWLVRLQRAKPVIGYYMLEIHARRQQKRRDIDNLIKATSDLLVEMQIVEDDSKCEQVICKWVASGPPMRVKVTPTERDS